MKKTSTSNPVKNLAYIKCYHLSVPPELLKALVFLSDTTSRRSAVNREDLKLHWKSEKSQISLGGQNAIIYKFLKDFTNHRKKTIRVKMFTCRPFSNILKYRDLR